ncbi:hypothetical protein [Xanthomonas arboricola]|uniref:hypothetical protein n=1 Tax=Xanthomonas arboricola TaxID=56448 RepID=UPI002B2AF467|nr:hypothetical protein X12_001566 [Xanthomonas arboricola]
MKRAISAPSQSQRDFKDRVRALGCVICRWRIAAGLQRPVQCGLTQIHHRNLGDLHGQKQIGQHAVVALGAWHHDGDQFPGMTRDRMREVFGPNFKHHAREFRIWTFDVLGGRGTEAWQTYQDQLLNIPRAA